MQIDDEGCLMFIKIVLLLCVIYSTSLIIISNTTHKTDYAKHQVYSYSGSNQLGALILKLYF